MKSRKVNRVLAILAVAACIAGCSSTAPADASKAEAAETAGTEAAAVETASAEMATAEQEIDPALLKEMDVLPLPVNERELPTVLAEKWLEIDEAAGSMEGLCFSPSGDLYFVNGDKVKKVTPPSKEVTVVFDGQGQYYFTSCDLHKDGRIFCCDIVNGRLVCIAPDGSSAEVVVDGIPSMDDICFDRDGNVYATQLIGEYRMPDTGTGKACVYKISADFSEKEVLFQGYYGSNGVFFSPDYKYLYTTEFFGNRLIRSQLDENWEPVQFYMAMPIYTFSGECGPDSVYVDAQGQVYQPLWGQGRFLIMDHNGTPFMNVLVPDRDKYMRTASVAIMPGTNTAYCCGLSDDGACIFTFEAPGTGSETFAFQK